MNLGFTQLRLILITLLCLATRAEAGLSEEDLGRVGYDQHPGAPISRNIGFKDATGRLVVFGDLLNTKPTLLVLGYYQCPMLCTLINDGLIDALQELRLDVGRDFNVINISIDPMDTPGTAMRKQKEYLTRYGRANAVAGWHFLTGEDASIKQLTNEAGFRYRYDSDLQQYAHPSGFIVLTPDGRISRYFFGVNFDPKEVRSALILAGNGKKGLFVKQFILLCYHYNPITGKYGGLILNAIRGAGVVTVVALMSWIISMCRRSSQSKAR
jgi:protein SCO1/2